MKRAVATTWGRILIFYFSLVVGAWLGEMGASIWIGSDGGYVFEFGGEEIVRSFIGIAFRFCENFLYPAGYLYVAVVVLEFFAVLCQWVSLVVTIPVLILVQMWDTLIIERGRDINGLFLEPVMYEHSGWGIAFGLVGSVVILCVLFVLIRKQPSLLSE